TSTASREVGAQGESDGIAGAGRTRLGAMANTVNQLAGWPSPLRWSWIGTGLLALVLGLGAVIVGRRGGR
ncbi:MAG: hypothetical protein M3O34_00495, partial [Chloroflexota bacterium]|nr:hypothetical protein [Chloroflexota bacterium]